MDPNATPGSAGSGANGSAGSGVSGSSGGSAPGVNGAGGMSSTNGSATNGAAASGAAANAAAAGGGSSSSSGSGDPATSGACAPTQLSCASSCVPNDVRNCGSCGHDCTALPNIAGAVRCSPEGKCEFDATACAPGYGSCVGDPELGCETDLKLPASCGACGTACGGGTPVCAGAMGCVSGCPGATPTLCGATCTDLQVDASHCGTCEQACKTDVARAMATCDAGVCGFKCPDGTTACGKACVDTKADVANCGACGMKCPSGASCNQGRCECGAGTHDCNGKCVSDTDVATCGTMCSPCRTTVANAMATCQSGTCGFMCTGSRTECSGTCVDTLSDRANCGRCGNGCDSGESCVLGLCACPFNQHICSNRCVSNTSLDACGTSGCMKCAGPTSGSGSASCDGTSCDLTCSASTPMKCGTACVNIYDDSQNCGACGTRCGNGTMCINGKCGCSGGKLTCDSSGLGGSGIECQDPNSINSCGTCWLHCPLDEHGDSACVNAQCTITCRAGYHLDEVGTCIAD